MCWDLKLAQTGVTMVVWSLPSTVPPPQLLFLVLFLWPCRCGGHPLEDSPAHSHPGRPARLHSWSYSAWLPQGWEGKRKQRQPLGNPGWAAWACPLTAAGQAGGGICSHRPLCRGGEAIYGAPEGGVTQTLKLKLFGDHMPPKLTQTNFGS